MGLGVPLLAAACDSAPAYRSTVGAGYFVRPETDDIRGACPPGYEAEDPKLGAPGAEYLCVYDDASPNPLQAQTNVAYPFRVHTHCGVRTEQFDGRVFVADLLTATGRPAAGMDPYGRMTLVSPDHARFVGRAGYVVTLTAVPAPPGLPGCQ